MLIFLFPTIGIVRLFQCAGIILKMPPDNFFKCSRMENLQLETHCIFSNQKLDVVLFSFVVWSSHGSKFLYSEMTESACASYLGSLQGLQPAAIRFQEEISTSSF